jgi:hypothetical protein
MRADATGRGDGASTLPLDQPIAFFAGARLHWKRFRAWTSPRQRAQCAICEAPFSADGYPGLIAGYSVVGGGPVGEDDYTWICAICYEAWRDACGWVVVDALGSPVGPVRLWESTSGLVALQTDAGFEPEPPPAPWADWPRFRLVWVDPTRR